MLCSLADESSIYYVQEMAPIWLMLRSREEMEATTSEARQLGTDGKRTDAEG